MCVTNSYTDRYPDGRIIPFNYTEYCQYGRPGMTCEKHSMLVNPVRNISFQEPTTEYIMTSRQQMLPNTPPRSAGGSHHRTGSRASYASSEDSRGHARHGSKRRSLIGSLKKPSREHRKERNTERIIIVDSPPTPRTPPQPFSQTFTAPSSPATPPYIVEGYTTSRERRPRPIIVDERPLHRQRAPSVGAVIGSRARRASPVRRDWDTPSSSHHSLDLQAQARMEREREEAKARADRERDAKIASLEANARLQERIRRQDEEIRNRPAIPIPSRPILRPVVDQSSRADPLSGLMGGLKINDAEYKIREDAEIRRRLAVRDRELKRELEMERREEDELTQRLRERQLPRRRFSVGPGNRRTRVMYDDGVYRWE